MFVWSPMLALSLIGNWIVTGDAIQVAEFGFAVTVVFGFGALLTMRSPQSARRGSPEHDDSPEAVPQSSLGAAGAGVAFAALLFGLVWAKFFVYLGAGMMLFALGRVWIELRAQRTSRRLVGGRDRA